MKQKAEEIFNIKAEYNKWLKELTNDEKELVLEMINEALRIHGSLPYTQEELDEYIEETCSWVHEPPAVLMHIVAKWVTEKFVIGRSEPFIVGRSEQFVCSHPPKRTYLLNGIWHCEECGGKWESIANE